MKAHLEYRSGRRPKQGSSFGREQKVHDVNIYTKSVAKSVVSWGEMPIFAYLKNLNSHEILKINGRQNQHLGAPIQTLLHHESALFSFKNAVFWGSFKTPHNQQREILWHHFWRGTWIIFYQLMKHDKTGHQSYWFILSLDGQSQLRTMAYGWTHDAGDERWTLRDERWEMRVLKSKLFSNNFWLCYRFIDIYMV